MAVTPICLPCPSLQDFVSGLSTILRGTIDDRLNWAFNLYDLNKDGCITKEVGWGGSRLVPEASASLHLAGTWQNSGLMAELWRRAQGVNIYLSSALQMSLLAPGTGETLGWRVDEWCAALGLHCTCVCTRGPTVCTEPAETHLSTPQVLQEHQEKGVGWGPGGGRAELQLTLQPCSLPIRKCWTS